MSEFALDGLKQVMAIKSRVVLPYLVPKVTPTWRQSPLAQRLQLLHCLRACCGDPCGTQILEEVGGGCRALWSGRRAVSRGHALPQSPEQQAWAAFLTLTASVTLQLTTPPVNTRVLAFLSSVAGDALTRHLGVILPAVMLALKEKLGTPDEQLVSVRAAPGGCRPSRLASRRSAQVSPVVVGDGQLPGRDPLGGG